ncbi:sensor histidine kinase [Actinacidiphila bryophytorum]|uniref:histidine kinase n=1 Tax=Actinacidiphila bryophytorum TaxID=1436133 RepID=A0A9W4MJB3_9ACTN|nr:HAMP domain-containing sensor histidine kinase [Actinacidiphila bryophytorum]MBM9435763.1 HAMP domain-containing histidine kinase [Actinacidiphila bryophytorum]MBN6541607.1 HAMP domain-containing histidine kinase [Actinacidiphila bryophytorum]CAG7650356.1 Histidine kinase [Actinacidiphila bryophytorum]
MTSQQPARRPLQTRLALAYAAGIYAAGVFVLVLVAVALSSVDAGTPEGRPSSRVTTGNGHGFSLAQLLTGSAVALVILIPVALALGWFVAGRFLRPLRAISATARSISAGNLHRRLDLGEPTDELTELGDTLDDLFARLQASFDAQRHFVANASHELRTPLAGLRTLLEVTLADPDADTGTLRSACQEALALGAHQERLVRALLVLATSERGVTRWDTLDLAHVVEGVLTSRRAQATDRGIGITEHLTPAATAGDPRLIESLVANLIDNAVRHNHPDGYVQVTTHTSATQAALTVTNSGPVIPAEQIQCLFHPFQKLAPDRHGHGEGYGLGLAIVNAVAQAHRATLTTRAPAEGGLSITVGFTQTSQ